MTASTTILDKTNVKSVFLNVTYLIQVNQSKIISIYTGYYIDYVM